MDEKNVIYEKDQGVALATLNGPGRFNAWNDVVADELLAVISDVERDASVRVLVITGAGSAFCGGGDTRVKNIAQNLGLDETDAARPGDVHAGYRRRISKVIRGLHGLDIATIAAVNGVAIGIGCDLALACDMRIGSEEARFSEAWILRGVIAAAGGTWFLPRMVGLGLAAELLLTGRFVDAQEALRIGLLNRLVPAAELTQQTMELARTIAKQPPVAVKLTKINLHKGLSIDLASALELSGASQSIATSTKDHEEAMAAFNEKREPKYVGR